MTRLLAIVRLAVIPLLSPMTGHAQLSVLHRSHFKIDKLSTRQDSVYSWVHGEITSNAIDRADPAY